MLVSHDLSGSEYIETENQWEIEDRIFVTVYADADLTMGCRYLLMISNKEQDSLIYTTNDLILSVKTDGDSCYLLVLDWGWYMSNSIVRVLLNEPNDHYRLGDAYYSYGRFTKARDSMEGGCISLELAGNDEDFQIREEGVYTIGYKSSIAPEGVMHGETRYEAFEQIQESYGYYLLPKYGGSHEFLENEALFLIP